MIFLAISCFHVLQVAGQAVHIDKAAASAPFVAGDIATGWLPSIDALAKNGWFGAAPEDAATGSQTEAALSDHFELRGVSQSMDVSLVGAFIAEIGQMERYYRIGSALPDNAGKLAGVFADHVTVQSGQKIRTLAFAKAPSAQAPGVQAPAAAGNGLPSPFYPLPPEAPPPKPKDPTEAELLKQFIAQPDKMLGDEGLSPVASGQKEGYRFNGGDNQGAFAAAGIMPDDIIKTIDGKAIGDPQSDRLLLPLLAASKTVDFNIQRGGQHLVVHYAIP